MKGAELRIMFCVRNVTDCITYRTQKIIHTALVCLWHIIVVDNRPIMAYKAQRNGRVLLFLL